MYIAYSAIKDATTPIPVNQTTDNYQYSLRLEAYQATCDKFCKEIAAIQKYIPGWVPAYPAI
jgi:hypothetical protein